MISSSDMLSVSNVRRNSFVLLDNNAEKSKKQKADYPRYHFVKASKHFVWELFIVVVDNGTIWDKV